MPWPELLAHTHFADPATLLAGLAAVGLVGLSKGGLGGAFALMGVPVLSLVMPPVQAAALLLPLLLMMDAVGLWTWRGFFDRATLVSMLPAAAVGIGVGGLTAAVTPEALVRLIVGVVALAFVARSLRPARAGARGRPRAHPRGSGAGWRASPRSWRTPAARPTRCTRCRCASTRASTPAPP
jgi:uncharacterized protein